MHVAAFFAVIWVAACVPQPETHSVDLSAIRIGAERGAIERAVGIESQIQTTDGRVVAIYRYGPNVEPGRAVACEPLTLGMNLSCALLNLGKKALAEKAAEDQTRILGESLLEVIYPPAGRAEWVVFAGSPESLARVDHLIAEAECGDATAQAEIARSFAHGTNGLPFDREEAYRWVQLAHHGNGVKDQEFFDQLTLTLAESRRQAIDLETKQWRPKRSCP